MEGVVTHNCASTPLTRHWWAAAAGWEVGGVTEEMLGRREAEAVLNLPVWSGKYFRL